MSILIHIRYWGQGDNARRFAREMLDSGTVAAIRSEPGNGGYDYYLPLEDPQAVLLVDQWRDQAALDAHHHTPMMDTIIALREKYDLHMQVKRYVSEDALPPDRDAAFIRK